MEPTRARTIFAALYGRYGPQHWWPAESPFEVMVGAVLTQNTAWTNVERALARLKAHVALDAEPLLALSPEVLAEALRPAGYFNVKARRLRALCQHCVEQGGMRGLSRLGTAELRRSLLSVSGVGPETADDMLLYAFARPVFVVDAYTRRIFSRLALVAADDGYEPIRARFEQALGPDVALYNEYHALIVRHGKDVCKTRPRCEHCVLLEQCSRSSASPRA